MSNTIKNHKIPEKVIEKWQNIVNIMANTMNISDALITRFEPPHIEVLQASQNKENIFEKGDTAILAGHYCEKVIKEKEKLKVNNALENEEWKDSIEADKGLLAYLGFPLRWPDGNVFGTICVHNVKETEFRDENEKLMKQFQELVEAHLKIIYQKQNLFEEIKEKKNMKTKLEKEKEFLNKTLNTQGALVVVLNKEGDIIRFNYEFQQITGYSENEVLNKAFWDIFLPKNEINEVKQVFQRITANNDFPMEYQNHIKTKNEKLRLISWKNTAITKKEEVKYVIATGLDITEQKKRMEKLKKQKEELNEANQQLTAYVEEITAMNEELEKTIEEVNELNYRFSNMVKIITDISNHRRNEEEFLSEILKTAIELVPEADYGKILIVDNEKYWKFVDAVGHKINKIQDIKLDEDVFQDINQDDIIDNNNYSLNLENLTEDQKNIMQESLKPIAKSRYINIRFEDETIGRIVLDIAKRSNKEFNTVTDKVLKSFSSLASAFFSFKRYNNLQEEFTKEIITSIIQILEMYDRYTRGHSENVAKISARIAEEMNLSSKEINDTYWAGMVHDMGKLLVPLNILNKPDKLNDKEYDIIKKHPYWGYKALNSSKKLKKIARYVLYHHERWDGQGYPDGLKGEEIPLLSQILSVADAWDAMTSRRSYREPLTKTGAIKELRKNKGKQFSPEVVDVILEADIL